MNSICALPDNNLKSVLVHEIFKGLHVADVMDWWKLSRFFRNECLRYIQKMPQDDLLITLKHKEDNNNNESAPVQRTYNAAGYVMNQGYILNDRDLSKFLFLCSNMKKFYQLYIQFPNLFITESSIAADFKKVFPGYDSFERKVPVEDLFIRSCHTFMLKWIEPDILIFRAEEGIPDWQNLPSVPMVQIHETAETLLTPAFFEKMNFKDVRCYLTKIENLDWIGVAGLIQQWRTNKREITFISFENDEDSTENLENFDVFEKLAAFSELVGPDIEQVAHAEHDPPCSVIGFSGSHFDVHQSLLLVGTSDVYPFAGVYNATFVVPLMFCGNEMQYADGNYEEAREWDADKSPADRPALPQHARPPLGPTHNIYRRMPV